METYFYERIVIKSFHLFYLGGNNMAFEYFSRFPQDVLSPSAQYVYFMSLINTEEGKYIIDTVSPSFNTDLSSSLHGGTKNIDDAFTFLDTVIASEYSKERSFLEYLKNKTKEIGTFNVPALDDDWYTFVKEIQENLGAGEHAIQAMKNELIRLQTQNERRGTKKNISGAYEQDQITKLTQYADMLNKFIDNRTEADTSALSNKIYGLVLSKYGKRLIQVDQNGNPTFNRSQLLGLMNTINSIILHDYVIKNSLDTNQNYKQFNTSAQQFKINDLEKIINSPEIDRRIDSILKEAEILPFVTNDMAENLGLIKEVHDDMFDKQQFQEFSNIIQNIDEYGYKLGDIGNLFHNLYRGYSVPESAFKITSNGNIYAESASVINAYGRGAFSGMGTGASGAKPDSLWGYITIDMDELLKLKSQDKNKYNQAIRELTNIHGELKRLSHLMKSTNTENYYNQQQWKWNRAVANIQKSLKILEEQYNLLGNCYIIEDSTKNYISLYGKTINNKLSDSMHGGSLGPNITDQINKISLLSQIGSISFPDAKWLISVIINSGPNMVASNQKNKIENYLAAFATILLFDDQINIVKEAYYDMANNLSKSTGNVEKIHLFSVNDGYYPLSFVLRMTRQALQKNYENAKAYIENTPSGGAKVEISGYVKEPQEAYKDKKAANQWITTRTAALSETKIHITFLVGFMGILNKLFPSLE